MRLGSWPSPRRAQVRAAFNPPSNIWQSRCRVRSGGCDCRGIGRDDTNAVPAGKRDCKFDRPREEVLAK